MSDITTVPFDYIVIHTKTENIVSQDEHGDYVCDIETEYIPLVRCKDCKYRYMDADLQVWTCTYGLMIKPNGFCNYGEREGE